MTKEELQAKVAELMQASTPEYNETAIAYEVERETAVQASLLVKKAVSVTSLDDEKINKQLLMTRRSEYGKVIGTLNILVSIYNFPVNSADEAKDIDLIREDILNILNLPQQCHTTLLDIKELRGNHSFIDLETFDVVPASEPDYATLKYLYSKLLSELNLPTSKWVLTPSKWNATEAKQRKKIITEQQAIEQALLAQQELAQT